MAAPANGNHGYAPLGFNSVTVTNITVINPYNRAFTTRYE